jgi:hypothetical protein
VLFYGKITITKTYVDKTAKKETRITIYPDASEKSVSRSLNGLPEFSTSRTSPTDTMTWAEERR